MFYRFADPWWLLLLAVLPALLFWHLNKMKGRTAPLKYSQIELVKRVRPQPATWTRHLLLGLRLSALALAIIALARPQSGVSGEEIQTEGIDIVLALDISSSMLAEDIEPNRVDAAKAVAAEFVRGRKNDRIGLVIFSGNAYTQCPLTVDYGVLTSLFDEIEVGMIEDGTAIGMGIGMAVNRLRDSTSKSKVVILLTDGRNNRGEIDPGTAAELAKSFGIKIYTVGAGTRGLAPYPVNDPVFGRRQVQVEVDIDEDSLRSIATLTGGQYFRATDRESLEAIYEEIDQMEKTEIEITEFTRFSELFHFPLGVALLLLSFEVGLANTRFRKIP